MEVATGAVVVTVRTSTVYNSIKELKTFQNCNKVVELVSMQTQLRPVVGRVVTAHAHTVEMLSTNERTEIIRAWRLRAKLRKAKGNWITGSSGVRAHLYRCFVHLNHLWNNWNFAARKLGWPSSASAQVVGVGGYLLFAHEQSILCVHVVVT